MRKAMYVIKRMSVFLRPYTLGLLVIMLIGACGSFFNIMIPNQVEKLSSEIESQIGHEIELSPVISIGALCGLLIVLMFICNYTYSKGIEAHAQRIAGDIRNALNKKINKISLLKLDQLTAGDLIAVSTADVSSISIAISQSIGPLLTNTIVMVGTVVVMLYKNVPMALCVIIFTISGVLICTLISAKMIPMRSASRMEQANINGMVDETINGFLVIRAFNSEQDVLKTFRDSCDRYTANLKKSQFVTNELTPLMSTINNITYVAVCIVGAHLMVNGSSNVNIGVIVAFMLYAKMLATPLSFFAAILNMLAFTMVNCLKIIGVLDMPENTDDGTKEPMSNPGAVTFRDVHFGYTEGNEVIHGFNAEIKPGMKVAIVGRTGAGKTTLVNLLMRFYETNSGQILIGGTDIKDIPRAKLHQILGMVMQETFLFKTSVRENVLYYREDATDEELNEVMEKCSLSHFIDALPQGIDTVLSENMAVSQGQKQLISIARTMIQNSPILILDEATSSVDTRTELLIQRALDELSKGRTSFVIAHRLSTIRNADVIFVMQDGDIVETGNHEQLLAKNGIYSRLYYSQFENAG